MPVPQSPETEEASLESRPGQEGIGLLYLRRSFLYGSAACVMVVLLYAYLFTVSNLQFLAMGAGGVVLFFWGLESSKFRFDEILLLLLLMSGLAVNAVVAGSDLLLAGLVISSFGVAAAIVSGDIGPKMARVLYLIFLVSMIIVMVVLGRRGGAIFAAGSRNYVSAIGIYFCATVYLTDDIAGNRKPVIWPAVATLFLSVYAMGRAGILVSAILLLTVLWTRFRARIKRQHVMSVLLVLAVILAVLVVFRQSISRSIIGWYSTSRFYYRGLESPRLTLWSAFFSELTLPRAIVGFDLNEIPIIGQYNGNPHNSFIKLWARTGIAGLLTCFVILFSLLKMWSRSKFLGMVYLVILLRAAFDIIILINWLDFVLFAYLFYAFRSRGSTKTASSLVGNAVPCLANGIDT